jgi:hypothetical protein
VDLSQSYVVNTTFPLGYERSLISRARIYFPDHITSGYLRSYIGGLSSDQVLLMPARSYNAWIGILGIS